MDNRIPVKFKNISLVESLLHEIDEAITEYIKRYNKNQNIEVAYHAWLHANKFVESDLTDEQKVMAAAKVRDLIDKGSGTAKPLMRGKYSIDYLVLCMKEYREKGAYSCEGLSSNPSDLYAYYDMLNIFIDEFRKTNNSVLLIKLREYIKKFLYGKLEGNLPSLSTIHMMKGDEADNIFIFDYPRFPYIKPTKSDEECKQESNLQYVAITRAKKSLYLCKALPGKNERLSYVEDMNTKCCIALRSLFDNKKL